MEKVRLGVVGCGNIVANAHTKGFAEEADRMIVTATCDIVLDRAKNAAETWGADYYTDDWTTMLGKVDAVLIALPHDLHHACGMFFLENGVHVLMEKPLAVNEQQCVDLIEASHKYDRLLMVAYPLRYCPEWLFIKDLIEKKTYGDLFQISLWTEQLTRRSEDNWMTRAKGLGGGQFFSHGCHYVDLLLWFAGEPKRGIHIGNNLGTPWMEKEGTSHAVIEFDNGVLGYHGGTWGARGTKLGNSFHFHFTQGMVEFDLAAGKIFYHSRMSDHVPGGVAEQEECTVIYESQRTGKNTVAEFTYFLDCLLEGKENMTPPEESIQGLRVIWKMYEAERDNKIVDLHGLGLKDDWKAVPMTEHGVWEEWEN